MKTKRHSTVEPVFGTLTQFMGMRSSTASKTIVAKKMAQAIAPLMPQIVEGLKNLKEDENF